jgi:hypothetical protein
VLSLTPPGASAASNGETPGWFEGGETTILKPWVLDYWRSFDASKGLEAPSLFDTVAPEFNRLTIFDSRLPHAVSTVRGTRDPRRGRLVLTGWFSEPQTCISGALGDDGGEKESAAQKVIDEALSKFNDQVSSEVSRVVGFLSVRIGVNADGNVSSLDALCDTLVADPAEHQGFVGEDMEGNAIIEDACADVRFALHSALTEAQFPKADGESTITVPVQFI